MHNSVDKRLLMIPINIVTIFQIVTIYLFFWGPIKYIIHDFVLDFIYLLALVAFLRLGYTFAINNHTNMYVFINYANNDSARSKPIKNNNIKYDMVLFLYFLVSLLVLGSRTGSFLLDFSSFNNMGEAYYARGNWNVVYERIVFVLSPITIMFIPYWLSNWRSTNLFRKLLFLIAVFFRVLVDLTMGVNKTFADLVIFLVIYVIYLFVKNKISTNGKSTKNRKAFIFGFILIIILFISFLLFFSLNILSRTANDPNGYSNGLTYFVSYLTEGYQAVDYSLTQPFTSTYGLGNSLYLLEIIDDNSLLARTYLMKNQLVYGWSYMVNWSSLYVWIGNDVSMIGVIPVMFLIGWLFGKTWVQSLYDGNNLASLIVLGLMFQLCIYSSANNQIVQLQTGFVGTWFWLLFWLFSAIFKKNLPRKKDLIL